MTSIDAATITSDNAAGSFEHIGRWCDTRLAMEQDFIVARSVRGGTSAMRAMRTLFLPRETRERQPRFAQEYEQRLLRTFLFSGYSAAVLDIASRPFQKAIELQNADGLDPRLAALEKNCDRRGTSLTRFFQRSFENGIDRGISFVLVDMPRTRNADGTKKTLAQMPNAGPYFSIVHPDGLIRWEWQDSDPTQLAEIQMYSASMQSDGKLKQDILLYATDHWETHSRTIEVGRHLNSQPLDGLDLLQTAREAAIQSGVGDLYGAYDLIDEGPNPLGKVPLVPAIFNPLGDDQFHVRPPLMDLAWKNVEQWVVASDYASLRHYAGQPIRVLAGLSADEAKNPDNSIIGPGATIKLTNPQAKASYLEPGGKTFDALRQADQDLRTDMTALGLQPMTISTTGPITATGEFKMDLKEQSKAQSWVEATDWQVYSCFELADEWLTKGAK